MQKEKIHQLSDISYPTVTQGTTVYRVPTYICQNCKKIFKYKSGLSRHKNYRCNTSDAEKSEMQNQIVELKAELKIKDKALEMKDKILEVNEKIMDKREQDHEFQKKLTVGAGQTVNKSLSAITYIMENYKNAPPLQPITQDEFKRLVYEENYGKKVHGNKKVTDFEASRIITSYFKTGTLVKLIGNIIATFYKSNKKELQSLWVTDASRKSFVVQEDDQWAIDKSGVKVSKIIVAPILIYIDKLMVTYMIEVHKILDKCNYSDVGYIEELKYSTELRAKLCQDKICSEIVAAISPQFYLIKEQIN